MNYNGETLYHHGVKGQKWGLRKYQNEDGSLTAAGREHYGYGTESSRSKYKQAKKDYKAAKKAYGKAFDDAFDYETRHPISTMTNKAKRAEANRRWDDAEAKEKVKDSAKEAYKQAKQEYKNSDEYKARQEKIKKAAIAGAAVAATALAAYGAYKVVNGKILYSKANKLEAKADSIFKQAHFQHTLAEKYSSVVPKLDAKAHNASLYEREHPTHKFTKDYDYYRSAAEKASKRASEISDYAWETSRSSRGLRRDAAILKDRADNQWLINRKRK